MATTSWRMEGPITRTSGPEKRREEMEEEMEGEGTKKEELGTRRRARLVARSDKRTTPLCVGECGAVWRRVALAISNPRGR